MIARAPLSLSGIDLNLLGSLKRCRVSPDGSAVWTLHNMPRPQNQTKWPACPSGPCMMGRMWTPTPPSFPPSWTMSQPFPPTPPQMPPSNMVPPSQRPSCPPTQSCSPSAPASISPSQPRSAGTTPQRTQSNSGNNEATRVYGFDLNDHWQADRDHYNSQKINGLTFPTVIRSSAFTQKLDVEGCDPLTLPVAALLYQQAHTANNHWLPKLAHGRELYLVPTGDIAAGTPFSTAQSRH